MPAPAPPSKVIPGTGFLVDGFRYANPSVRAYFLSHAHSDHYTGLNENWEGGPIYCSNVTARLIVHMLGVDAKYMRPLPLNLPQNVDGVEVVLVDANHCPGAVQFIFKLPNGKRYLHCGDMRFCPEMLENPHIKRLKGVNAIFLDTTYCNPKYAFPPQVKSIEYVAQTIVQCLKEQEKGGPKCLFLISTYGIGKERILVEIRKQCDVQLCVTARKMGVMRCLDWEDAALEDMFTLDAHASPVHVVKWGFLGDTWPYFRPNFVNMEKVREESGVDKVVGFVPTGWMYDMKRVDFPVRKKGNCEVHLVPYSEHSSYMELREFVKQLKPEKVIPTVGVGGEDGDKKETSILKHFCNLIDETASKAKFIKSMEQASSKSRLNRLDSMPDSTADTKQTVDLVENENEEKIVESNDAGEMGGPEKCGDGDRMRDVGVVKVLNEVGCDTGTGREVTSVDVACEMQIDEAESEQLDQGGCVEVEGAVEQVKDADADSDCTVPIIMESLDAKVSDEIESKAKCDSDVKDQRNPRNLAEERRDASPASDDTVPITNDLGDTKTEEMDEMEVTGGKDESGVPDSDGYKLNGDVATSRSEEVEVIDPALAQVLSVLSGQVNTEAARKLLERSKGNVEAAINRFYDTSGLLTPTRLPGKSKQKRVGLNSSGRGKKRPGSVGKVGSRKKSKWNPGQMSIRSMWERAVTSKPDTVDLSGLATSGTSTAGGSKQDNVNDSDKVLNLLSDDDTGKPGVASMSLNKPGKGSRTSQHKSGEPSDELGKDDTDGDWDLGSLEEILKVQGKGGMSDGNSVEEQKEGKVRGRVGKVVLPDPKRVRKMSDALKNGSRKGIGDGVKLEPGGQSDNGNDTPVNLNPEEVAKDAVLKPVNKYDPIKNACWKPATPPPYLHLARTFQALDSTSKRLKIGDALTNMFRSVLALSPEALLPTVYLTCGKIASEHCGEELNVGGSTVANAITEATGCTRARLRELYKDKGDFGDVAQACRQTQTTLVKPAGLTIPGVFSTLKQISQQKGNGSTARRQNAVLSLLRACRECETKYIVRTLIQNLRVGANWRTVVGALGRASIIHREGCNVGKKQQDDAAADVCEAFHLCPSFDSIVPVLVEGGVEEVKKKCTMVPGIPIKPMLAKISEGIQDCVTQMRGSRFLAEYKYDGQRAQIHVDPKGNVSIFSRRCEDKTAAFPDVASAIKQALGGGVDSIVLDAELVAVDRENGNKLMAFQDLSRRSRVAVEESEVKIKVCVFAFDLLYLNGEALLKRELRERRDVLGKTLANSEPGLVEIAKSIEIDATGEHLGAGGNADGKDKEGGASARDEVVASRIQSFLLEAFGEGGEGLMLKRLDGVAGYEPSKRSEQWLKVKKDYCDGLNDSLDLVPIGAWHGTGRKFKWFSPFLMAAYDPASGEFQSLCRCMSGFTDAFYREATARLGAKIIDAPKLYYRTNERPSVWFEPTEVWEIRGADLTVSPVHQAALGKVHEVRGVGLRFPRFIRMREDKSPLDATSSDQIAELYAKQTRRANIGDGNSGEDALTE